jgi:hypothetical protein
LQALIVALLFEALQLMDWLLLALVATGFVFNPGRAIQALPKRNTACASVRLPKQPIVSTQPQRTLGHTAVAAKRRIS